ncbi:hypothetical protein H6A65_00345 [Mediterraneibacter glycyrrhizinilyticus]|uniref:hypothetical protein n=1 Tax=Mediterraneibacter glycyrrhizinilyticus TaxID=342942 RepID=UPI0019617561|nr:hypothetical protein [Mediterraneibacter glycyrrhizinilyticus]MBM6749952.1 hypothetical protein [Mediterraneibacter glycyrrhizinilyticus]
MEICICDDEKKLRNDLRSAVETELQLNGISCAIRPLDPLPGKLLAWFLFCIVGSVRLFAGDPVNIIGTLGLFLVTVFLLFRGQWFVKLGIVMIFYPIVAAFNFLHNSLGAYIFFTF